MDAPESPACAPTDATGRLQLRSAGSSKPRWPTTPERVSTLMQNARPPPRGVRLRPARWGTGTEPNPAIESLESEW